MVHRERNFPLHGLLTAAVVLALALTSSLAYAGKRVALVIGNSAYQYAGTLANPKNDAADLAAVLRANGFQVVDGFDLDKAALDRKIRDFAVTMQGAEVGLFFYAGHGLQVAGQNYIVPIDAQLTTASALDFEMVRLDLVHRTMEREAQTNILFLDACRDNPLARNLARAMGTRSMEIGRGLAAVESGVGTLISFSTQPGNVALDGTGRNSPFAGALAKHLSSSSEDLSSVLIAVRNDVIRATNRQQVPWEHSALTGRFYFKGAPQASPAPLAVPAPSATTFSEAERAWGVVKDTTNVGLLEAFVARYRDTFYGDLARARIEELRKQQTRPAPAPPANVALLPPPGSAAAPMGGAIPSPTPTPTPSPTPSASPARTLIRIGVGGPMTGGSSFFGAQIRNGTEQAVAEINAAGGILGQKIQVSIGDDRADPREGVSVANKFAAEGVKFVVGHFNSGVTIPASDVYATNDILEITPSATNPKVTERNLWNIFRTCGRDDMQGPVAAAIIADKFRGKRIAVVHDNTTYGHGLAEETRKAMNAKGLTEVLFEGVNTSDKDHSAVVAKIKAARADLVYWGGLHDTGGLILRQLRDQGVKAAFMGADGITDDEFAAIAGAGAEGTLMTFSPDPRLNPANKQIIDVFRKKGFEPQAYTLYSYGAVQILKQAAEAARSLDPKKVAEVMRSGRVFNTVLGDLSYDKKGDVTGYTVAGKRKDHYVLYVWKKGPDGRITYVEAQ